MNNAEKNNDDLKKTFRKKMLDIRDSISKDTIISESSSLTQMVLSLDEYKRAGRILTYMSFGSEVKTSGIIVDALKNSKKVAIPRVISKGVMRFYYFSEAFKSELLTEMEKKKAEAGIIEISSNEGIMCSDEILSKISSKYLEKSRFGIYEPYESDELLFSEGKFRECEKGDFKGEIKEKQSGNFDTELLMVLPGVAFDYKGFRLGYGGGFYDRFVNDNRDRITTTVAPVLRECLVDEVPAEEHDIAADILLVADF